MNERCPKCNGFVESASWVDMESPRWCDCDPPTLSLAQIIAQLNAENAKLRAALEETKGQFRFSDDPFYAAALAGKGGE